MKSRILSVAATGHILIILASAISAQTPTATAPINSATAITEEGCYSASNPLVDQGSFLYQSEGYCQTLCVNQSKPVGATTKGSNCFCGDLLPPKSFQASDLSCNSPCNGYGQKNCGGNGFWSVFLTGLESNIDNAPDSSSSAEATGSTDTTATASVTASISVITQAGQTIFLTASSQPQSTTATSMPLPDKSNTNSGGKSNKTGIAAGVVAGVVVVTAAIGGGFFFVRHRKRRSVEEEHRRNTAVKTFISSGKTASETGLENDSRLDPSIMQHRRQSDGSIADERDFSRRILQVRNPDST